MLHSQLVFSSCTSPQWFCMAFMTPLLFLQPHHFSFSHLHPMLKYSKDYYKSLNLDSFSCLCLCCVLGQECLAPHHQWDISFQLPSSPGILSLPHPQAQIKISYLQSGAHHMNLWHTSYRTEMVCVFHESWELPYGRGNVTYGKFQPKNNLKCTFLTCSEETHTCKI